MRTRLAAMAAAAGPLWAVVAAAALPFSETFEERTPGGLDGQSAWRAVAAAGAAVQAATVYGGTQAGSVSNSVVWQDFSSTATNVWVDFYARPARRTTAGDPTPGTNSVIAFYVNSNGYLRVYSNSTWVTLTGYTVPTNDWTRLTAHLDYLHGTWALYACSSVSNQLAQPLATNLAFRAGAAGGTVGRLRFTAGAGGAKSYLDSVTVADHMVSGAPLDADADGDGMPDQWEADELGGTGADPDGDLDNDGVSNRREFLAGTHPNSTSSFMRIVSLDLAAPDSSDIRVDVRAGDHPIASAYAGDAQAARRFIVRAANNDPDAPKSTIGTVTDDGSGTNVYTDANAATLHARRYYEVAVSHGGEGYTNATEEWALYTQPRAAGTKSLVCVPVNYEGTNNTLQGTLGAQLARGLYAHDTNGDKLQYWTGGTWVECILASDGKWYTNAVPAEIEVTPGMALWVVRGGESAPRANAVFTGKSFAEAQAVDFTFNAGSWTAFGWPLARERAHSSGTSAPNQLGFYAVGTGGKVSTTDAAKLGDEIWAWKNNTWAGWYSLIGNTGSAGDGRWWDNFTRRYADITLEPGVAYYYRHRDTWGATNFTWRPQVP